jgi:L-seryl-tRNA(Ser) seleniumtransferase
MVVDKNRQDMLRRLPGVDHILEFAKDRPAFETTPKSVLVASVRAALADLRQTLLAADGDISTAEIGDERVMAAVEKRVAVAMRLNLRRTVNASGVVVHTNLGRSILSDEACRHITDIAKNYSNLEYDLEQGARGSRYSAVVDLICELTGAADAMVVNNNAAAVLLCLDTVAKNREVIVSRGELVEIGGSFRVPDVMEKSGAVLKEVGTTNRTHLRDYENAINSETGLLLKVHTSNYHVVGFTKAVTLGELVKLGAKQKLPVMEDLGSGTLIDFADFGLPHEPTVQESVASGADLISFSGDKLLGGPQAGIVVGQKRMLAKIRDNPLTRALRIDKLTLAALESTLRLYRDPRQAVSNIPTLAMLTRSAALLKGKARQLEDLLNELADDRLKVESVEGFSKAGGGSLPLLELPSHCVAISVAGISARKLENHLRKNDPAIIARIESDRLVMDLRTISKGEPAIIVAAVKRLLQKESR